jgi:plastocyanin
MLLCCLTIASVCSAQGVNVSGSITAEPEGVTSTASVVWLTPAGVVADLAPPAPMHAVLTQKNKAFEPHLLVITRGSSVEFPNRDPWFHNVFSLFNGKRFDLGLYEAGTSRTVHFDREGISFIFCNIHPEMSAVILALSTPLYSIASGQDTLQIRNIPEGAYTLHFWIEGVQQKTLDGLERNLQITSRPINLPDVHISVPVAVRHDNMFGHPYENVSPPTY